jgi:hypothetical protein
MRRLPRLVVTSVAIGALFVACGARTELWVDEPPKAAADGSGVVDQTSPDHATPADATHEALADVGPIREGGARDVVLDCPTPSYCQAGDDAHVYQCGEIVYDCSSLEQCEEQGESGAACVNPCLDTLGQNTSNGCDFYAVEMDTTAEVEGVCFAVFVVNQWPTGEPARLEVSQNGQVLPIEQFARIPVGQGTSITYAPYDANAGLAQDDIAILFLSRDPAALDDPDPSSPRALASCPAGVTPAVVGDASYHGTGIGTAFRVKSNVPVVAYQMLPYGGGSARVTGATLLLPTNAWGTNYLAANAYGPPTLFTEDRAGPTMVVIAQQDATHVTINPTSMIFAGGGLAGTSSGVPVTYTVDAGQYLQFTQLEELTGSAIQSDAPVAVIGGSTLLDIPYSMSRADGAEQMLPPVQALGSVYVAVRYRSRRNRGEEIVPWRIVAAVDGTTFTFDPPQPGAPATLDAQELAEFDATGPFVVSSQGSDHPFYFAQYMTGGQYLADLTNQSNGEGDPEYVNVVTPAQYLPKYTFFTDPTYPETNLVVVRVLDPTLAAFPDVTLDCSGLLTGWAPVGTSGKYQFTRIDLSTGDFEGQNGCDNGVHVIHGSFPGLADGAAGPTPMFGLTVWGWGNTITWPTDNGPEDEENPLFTRWVSYGYPAGVNVTPLNSVVLNAH